MPDYGHQLRFGTFITPVHTPVTHGVQMAQLAEELGFDLATFQDHPYQPLFHDTLTLLTWVAARTSTIHVSGNVLNLPLRPPAVLARAAASVDLLSAGRFSLGLGAGAFWDAIEAMGGGRLTAGQSVDALGDAIDVIRGMWDTTTPGPLRAGGDWHQVDGVKPGPAPAHQIPIWLGALRPRMQQLVGQKADGWLPSLQYLGSDGLSAGNRIIDEAAERAGREPREITRLLNISPGRPTEELVRMAVENGVSVFILAADDPRQLEEFADQVMPTVREGVERERAARGTPLVGRSRSPNTLALRMPGIDYDGAPASLSDDAVEPGDKAYRRYRATYMRGGAPAFVLRPRTIEQVRDAVAFAKRHRDVPLGILSAGHGVSGRSINHGGLVIDVSAFNTIEILDAEAARVRIGPGARWVDVARSLAPFGLAISSGDHGGVGVGGLATAGGVGWFARKHGLTIDHMRAVDVVLADGSAVRASDTENADLFWAMRGAGANFGIATSFEFEAARVGEVGFAQLVFDATDTAELLQRWGAYIENSDRAVSGETILGSGRDGRRIARVLLALDSEDSEEIISHLKPIADVAPLLDQNISMGTYDQLIGMFVTEGPQQGHGEPSSRSGLIEHLTPEFAGAVATFLDSGASPWFQIRTVGGAVADVPAAATAYAGREANFSVVALGSQATRIDKEWDRLLQFFEGMYSSFETTTPAPVERAFPPAHLQRLRQLKRRYDPTGLFRDNFFIDPLSDGGTTAG